MRFALLSWLALALAAPPAAAFQLQLAGDGRPLRWAEFPLYVRIAPPLAGVRARFPFNPVPAVRGAIQQWQAIPSTGAALRYAGPAPALISQDPLPGEVLVTFDGADFPGGGDVTGLTQLTVSSADVHVITGAHVHLNARDYIWATSGATDALDVWSVALHELGHVLGIAHPCGDLNTAQPSCAAPTPAVLAALQTDVMWLTLTAGPRRTFTADDVSAAAAAAPVLVPTPAPLLISFGPSCLPSLAGQKLSLGGTLNGATHLLVAADGTTLVDSPILTSAAGEVTVELPSVGIPDAVPNATPGRYDVLLVNDVTAKASENLGALQLGDCAGGCSTGGPQSLWPLLGLLAFVGWRPRRGLEANAKARADAAARARAAARAKWIPGGCALAFALILCPSPAHAYKRSVVKGTDLCTFWATRGHSFMIDAKGTPDVPPAQAFDAIRKSFQAWSSISCSDLAFPDLGISEDPADRRTGFVAGAFNRNLVFFRTVNCATGVVPPGDACLTEGGCANKYDCWDSSRSSGGSIIATTTTTSNRYTGQIADSDIEMNDAPDVDGLKFTFTANDGPPCLDTNQTNCVRYDIRNTVTHEAGHTVGLDHTTDETATMYASAPEGETAKRNLHPDDIQAICDTYPLGAPVVSCLGDPLTVSQTGGSNGGGCGCATTSTNVPGLEAVVLASLGLALSRSRRAAR